MSSRPENSLAPSYFDEKYKADPDPWNFATSSYEQQKYMASFSALDMCRYANALELGCSIGVFTQKLAKICNRLLAVDVSLPALSQARKRCRDLLNVEFQKAYVPGDWPAGSFDLFVLSEILYYLNEADLKAVTRCIERSRCPDTTILLVHWIGATDYPLSGDEAAEIFIQETRQFATVTLQSRTEGYRLDRLECRF